MIRLLVFSLVGCVIVVSLAVAQVAGIFTVPPGSWSTSGTNAAEFSFSGSSLRTNGSTPTCSGVTTIPLNIVASYPGAPSFTQAVTITCNPSGGGGVPGPAQLANMTTCIICMDFTQSTGGIIFNGTPAGGRNAADPSTWEDCAGSSSPLVYKQPLLGVGPCGTVDTDATHGNKAWHIIVPALSTDGYNAYISQKGGVGIALPTAQFMRVVVWHSSFPVNAYINETYIGGTGIPNNSNLDFDSFEIDGRQTPFPQAGMDSNVLSWITGLHGLSANWFGSYPPNFNGYDPTSGYHTIDQRITHDGSTTLFKCMWLDGNFQNCVSSTVDGSAFQSSQLSDASREQIIYTQPGCNCGTGGFSIPQYDTYIKEFDVWSCASWQSTNCHTANPNP